MHTHTHTTPGGGTLHKSIPRSAGQINHTLRAPLMCSCASRRSCNGTTPMASSAPRCFSSSATPTRTGWVFQQRSCFFSPRNSVLVGLESEGTVVDDMIDNLIISDYIWLIQRKRGGSYAFAGLGFVDWPVVSLGVLFWVHAGKHLKGRQSCDHKKYCWRPSIWSSFEDELPQLSKDHIVKNQQIEYGLIPKS